MLGRMFYWGIEIPKDHAEAVKWYMKAAEQGEAYAHKNLGLMYRDGRGVAKDQAEARKLITKAADQGNEDAKKELRKMGATLSR